MREKGVDHRLVVEGARGHDVATGPDRQDGTLGKPGFRGCAIMDAAAQHHVAADVRGIAARHLERYLDLLAARAGDPAFVRCGRGLLGLFAQARALLSEAVRAGCRTITAVP